MKPLRYDLTRTRAPEGSAEPSGRPQDEFETVSVPDPWQDVLGPRTERVQALARVDLLERELKCGRIDEAAYYTGRQIQRVLEIETRIHPQSLWSDAGRVDNGGETDAPGRRLILAQTVEDMRQSVEAAVSGGWEFLARMLAGSWTFSAYAAVVGGNRERVAERFREVLTAVSYAWGAKGGRRNLTRRKIGA